MNRMAAAAIEAAFNEGKPEGKQKRGRSGMRAVAAGAALAVAARVAIKRGPGMPQLPDLGSVSDLVRDRLSEHGLLDHDDVDERLEDELDEEPLDEGDEDFEDEEPEDEGDEDFDDDEPEDDDGGEFEDDEPEEPEDEGGASFEDEEPEDEGDEDFDEEEQAEDDDGARAPALAVRSNGASARENERLDPAARPPQPPRGKRKAAAHS